MNLSHKYFKKRYLNSLNVIQNRTLQTSIRVRLPSLVLFMGNYRNAKMCLQFGILFLLCRNAFLITCWVLDSDLCSCIVTLDADVTVLLQTEDAFIVVEDEDAEACFKDCRC